MEKKFVFIVFLIFCYFSFFLRLTSYPLLMWDESRVAESAFEMLKTQNFLIPHFNGVPDMWNTKPPLAVWVVAVCMKAFGYSELAVRLPSAIAALLTALFIFRFVSKNQKDTVPGFFSGMVLISSIGYIGMHVARTGDADALLVLFLTLFCLAFYEFLQDDSSSKKLFLAALFFALAFLTKSSNALLPIPGLVAYIFIQRKQRIFLSPTFYLAGFLSVLPFIIYCIVRENMNPGYLSAMWQNDFGGRYLGVVENHSHGVSFYFVQLWNKRFFYWFIILLMSVPALLLRKGKKNTLLLFSAIVGFSILASISFSKTQLDWYDAAVYPFFSIVVGISLSEFLRFLLSKIHTPKPVPRYAVSIVFFVLIFFYPYRKTLSYINIKPGEAAYVQLKYGPFIKKIIGNDFSEPLLIYEKSYNSHLLYYKNVFNERGKDVRLIYSLEKLVSGNLVTSCDSAAKLEIGKKYVVEIFAEDKYCSCFRIK